MGPYRGIFTIESVWIGRGPSAVVRRVLRPGRSHIGRSVRPAPGRIGRGVRRDDNTLRNGQEEA